MKGGVSKKRITIASILGSVITLQMGALSVSVQTLLSGITELPFGVFAGTMLPIHLAIGLVEGLITAAVLCFVYEARPELLWGTGDMAEQERRTADCADADRAAAKTGRGRLSFQSTLLILAVAAALTGGILSLYASAFPDGLEWSMEQVAGTSELESGGGIYDTFAGIQEKTSILPDYSFRDGESSAGTTVSGIAGALLTAAVCIGAGIIKRTVKGRKHG